MKRPITIAKESEEADKARLEAETAAFRALRERFASLVMTFGERPQIKMGQTVGGQRGRDVAKYLTFPCLKADDGGAKDLGGRDDTDGVTRGASLWLAMARPEDGLPIDPKGSWLLLTYRGRWTRWQNQREFWKATAETLTDSQVAAIADPDDVTAALTLYLERRADMVRADTEASRKATETARELVAKLKAGPE